jgi:hypothetical protein
VVRLNPTTMSLRDGQTRSPAVASTTPSASKGRPVTSNSIRSRMGPCDHLNKCRNPA